MKGWIIFIAFAAAHARWETAVHAVTVIFPAVPPEPPHAFAISTVERNTERLLLGPGRVTETDAEKYEQLRFHFSALIAKYGAVFTTVIIDHNGLPDPSDERQRVADFIRTLPIALRIHSNCPESESMTRPWVNELHDEHNITEYAVGWSRRLA